MFLFALNRLLAQDSGDVPFDTRADAAFGDPTLALREFLRDRHIKSHKPQHFCAVGYQDASGMSRRAWVHWPQGGQIILWEGATDPASAKTAIARSRRVTDLGKDVVATEAEVKGSTYLVMRSWVDRITKECDARGAKYTVRLR